MGGFDIGFLVFLSTIVSIASIYAILSLALNLQYGYTGIYNFGLVMFYMIGAYTTALLTAPPASSKGFVTLGLPFFVAIPVSMIIAGGIAYLIAIPTFKLRDDYFALATLAFAEIFRHIFINESWLAGGTFGTPAGVEPFGQYFSVNTYPVFYAFLSISTVVIIYFFMIRLVNSSFGILLRAVRDGEQATLALGKQPTKAKLEAWVIGCSIAGLAGALWSPLVSQVTPSQFFPLITFLVWVGVLVGGRGNFTGVLIGGFFIAFAQRSFQLVNVPGNNPAAVPAIQNIFLGVLLIFILRYRPRGLVPEAKLFKRQNEGAGRIETFTRKMDIFQ